MENNTVWVIYEFSCGYNGSVVEHFHAVSSSLGNAYKWAKRNNKTILTKDKCSIGSGEVFLVETILV